MRSAAPHCPARWDELIDIARRLRPELSRYCARLTGSSCDGEDVVQDTLERAFAAVGELPPDARLRPWLFRIARNRALDLIRSRRVRRAEPLEAAWDLADPAADDPLEVVMRRQALEAHLSRLVGLGPRQRAVFVLKDVLGDSLLEIAARLGLTMDAVKALLARARGRVRATGSEAPEVPARGYAELVPYLALLKGDDWEALRTRLADDVASPRVAPSQAGDRQAGPCPVRPRKEVGSRPGKRRDTRGRSVPGARRAADVPATAAVGRPIAMPGG